MEYEIGSDDSVSMSVVRAVSAVTGREPCSLRPLAEVVDPEALDSLFDEMHDGTPRSGGSLSFVYAGCRVSIENDEYLHLDVLADPSRGTRRPEVADTSFARSAGDERGR